ncbi:hypothetical protein SEA_GINGERBUG_54 [Microbacterium phage Gingerbug]|nr:hypothetical protein SEA_GINGERBUG_54 [Microbacterium phage Gingerbug]
MKWLTAEGSRRAHALRESSRVTVPSVRVSMCGRIAWHRRASEAEPGMRRCAGCLTAIARRANV